MCVCVCACMCVYVYVNTIFQKSYLSSLFSWSYTCHLLSSSFTPWSTHAPTTHHLQTLGRRVAVISGNVLPLIEPLCTRLDFSCYCSSCVVDDGVFTGYLEGEPLVGRRKVRDLCRELVITYLHLRIASAHNFNRRMAHRTFHQFEVPSSVSLPLSST